MDVAQDRWRLGCSGRRAPPGQVWGVPVLTQAAPKTHHKAWGKLGAHRKKVTLSKLLFRNVQIAVTEVFRQPSPAGEVPPLGSLAVPGAPGTPRSAPRWEVV